MIFMSQTDNAWQKHECKTRRTVINQALAICCQKEIKKLCCSNICQQTAFDLTRVYYFSCMRDTCDIYWRWKHGATKLNSSTFIFQNQMIIWMHEVMRLDKRQCRSLHIALKFKKKIKHLSNLIFFSISRKK